MYVRLNTVCKSKATNYEETILNKANKKRLVYVYLQEMIVIIIENDVPFSFAQ